MKYSLLPILAAALPIILVQHATLVNGAALCIPNIYCPQSSPTPLAVPACSSPGGGEPPHSSPTGPWTTVEPPHTPTTTVPVPTHTSPPVLPSDSTTTSAPTHLPGGGSSSGPAGSSHGGGQPTVTTTITVTGQPAPTGSSCSTGPVQCCDTVEPASSEGATQMLGLLGIALQGLNVPVGLNCIPVDVLGGGSAGNCNAQTVCCENNNFSGLINIGCSPINIGL